MRGHIVQRSKKKGTWSIVVELDKDPVTGKRRQKWVTFQGSHTGARKHLTELLHQFDTGMYITPVKQTVSDYLTDWLNNTAYPNMALRTYEGYRGVIYRHIIPSLGNIALLQLKPQQIKHLYSGLIAAGKARTCEYCHFTLRKALRDAVRMGILPRNPTDQLDRPKVSRHEISIMPDKDIHLFLEFAWSTEYYPLFYTLLFTGLRRNEALALRWSDIDLLMAQLSVKRSLIQLGKGQVVFTQSKTAKARRVIALTPSTVAVLMEHKEAQKKIRAKLEMAFDDSDLVFSHYDGTLYRPDTISHSWLKLAKKTGENVRLHDARHSHASLMLKAGVHPKIV